MKKKNEVIFFFLYLRIESAIQFFYIQILSDVLKMFYFVIFLIIFNIYLDSIEKKIMVDF